MGERPTLSVIIPAFNAAGHIARRLSFLQESLERSGGSWEIIVVDDGSSDQTWAIVESLGVRALRSPSNQGKFAAIKLGMSQALGACRVFTDSDVPYDPVVMETLVEHTLGLGFHLVVGDRTLKASVYDQQVRPLRRVATTTFRHAVRLLVTGELPDTQCGIKGFRADVAEALFPLIQAERFAGDVELLYIALKHNLAIRRVPVRLVNQGTSSLRPIRDGAEMLRQISRLRARYRRGEYDSAELDAIGDPRQPTITSDV